MNPHPAPAGTPWLQLRNARLRLGGQLFFRGIDWEAHEGEQWALLGPNGAGKTVLCELALGQLHPAGGEAWLRPDIDRGRDVGWVSWEAQQRLCAADARHDISEYMESAVDPGTTVRALLAATHAEPQAIATTAQALGITALQERGMRFLSSGETRRALLARLLLARPAVAVLDNPFEGIDAHSRALMKQVLAQLLESPTRVLLLTRCAAEIPAGISHVLQLEQGRITACGPRAAVLAGLSAGQPSPAAQTLEPPLPTTAPALPEADAVSAAIELRGVTARYGDNVVLDSVDLHLARGEHLCLAGPNGCGKSTLLALICGDNPRAYGQQVRVFGHLRGGGEPIRELKRRFGIVSNALHLAYPARSRVKDVVASGFFDTLGLYQDCSQAEAQSAGRWLEALGLAAHAQGRFDALSFGTQRLVLIARAMVKSPPLLILDEPCSGLDEPNRARVLALADRIAATGHTQLLYVSHESTEMPRCITRRVEFRLQENGRYALFEA